MSIRYNEILFILLMLYLFPSAVFAAEKNNQNQQIAQQLTRPQTQPRSASVNSITQAAVNAGALSCASRINQVSNFLMAGSKGVGAQMYVSPQDPDRSLVSISLEIQYEREPSAFASASFAPNQANGCGSIYEAIVYWNMKCDDVATKQFTGLKKIGALSKEIVVLDGGPLLKVFLMPAGFGCISIKREVVQ